jgi:hypothetical protein
MKVCPVCKATYNDPGLRFCLNDGSPLQYAEAENETVVSGRDIPLDIQISPAGRTSAFDARQTAPAAPAKKSNIVFLLAGILLLFFLTLAAVGGAGVVFYYRSGEKDKQIVANNIATPTPATAATTDAEKEKIKDQLANLQRQLDQQKNSKPANTQNWETPHPGPDSVDAYANSPADGFLALRSEPDSERGSRVTKIPHGAKISIGKCGQYITTGRGNYGRWCTATYDGYSGWVFDAFVRY